jgi:hypothetical protein
LRQIKNMVRLRRVERIESNTIVLAQGASPPILSGCTRTARGTVFRGGLRCLSSTTTRAGCSCCLYASRSLVRPSLLRWRLVRTMSLRKTTCVSRRPIRKECWCLLSPRK